MASEIQICNLALSRLGGQSIASLEEASREARLAKLFYAPTRDAALRDHHWNFATRRCSLALLPDESTRDFAYAYGYPSDCLAAWELQSAWAGGRAVEFTVELATNGASRRILTNAPQALLVYTARVTDPGLFDPLFIEAFSWKLAAELARPLVNDIQVQKACLTVYQNAVLRARGADAGEGLRAPAPDCPWLQARS